MIEIKLSFLFSENGDGCFEVLALLRELKKAKQVGASLCGYKYANQWDIIPVAEKMT